MANPSFPFRLREPRMPLAFPVLVEWKDDIRRHVARNISDSGIFIDADRNFSRIRGGHGRRRP